VLVLKSIHYFRADCQIKHSTMTPYRIAVLLFAAFSATIYGQKNVVEISRSEALGINLPAGSKQDKRIFSVAAAGTLLEMKAGELGRSSSGNAEVLILPSLSGDGQTTGIKQLLTGAGFKITDITGDLQYSILNRDDKNLLIYISEKKTGTELYSVALKKETTATSEKQLNPVITPDKKYESVPETKSPETMSTIQPASKPLPVASAFTFITTNFDDGWIATVKDDFVEVTKEKIAVRLYYPVGMTEKMRPPASEVHDYFWNSTVLPSFEIKNVWQRKEETTYFPASFIYAEAVEKKTGKQCFICLYVVVNSGIANPVLGIADSKQSFEQVFPDPGQLRTKLGYNRFAIALKDLSGTWASSSSSGTDYYNAYTGAYAGMEFNSSYDIFTFNSGGSYSSKHSGSFGMIGNTKVYNQEYAGQEKVSEWELTLTNRFEGKTDVFEAWFEAVQGGRILRLINKQATGIKYQLIKTK
jgi:hypothetical protein